MKCRPRCVDFMYATTSMCHICIYVATKSLVMCTPVGTRNMHMECIGLRSSL
ncbi:hypothetical protein BDV25DRAFT_161683, partial [Aspergillus avenaceus]